MKDTELILLILKNILLWYDPFETNKTPPGYGLPIPPSLLLHHVWEKIHSSAKVILFKLEPAGWRPQDNTQTMDYLTLKTPNPKCRLYWVLIEFIDWRYSQSCCFSTQLCDLCPSQASLWYALPPPPFPVWISILYLALLSISLIFLRYKHIQGSGSEARFELTEHCKLTNLSLYW